MNKRNWIVCLFLMLCVMGKAQEYIGTSGLIHVPSAEMLPAGTARIGAFFLNKESVPDNIAFRENPGDAGIKYNTFNHFLSIAPFSWIELAYTCTFEKGHKNMDKTQPVGYYYKDRFFSIKLRPLKEGKWYPAIAIGANDPFRHYNDHSDDYKYFMNFYLAATKHFDFKGHELGVHLAYRYYPSEYNKKWQGVVGGITYRPSFAKNLRGIVEYTGNDVNVGVDCYLWKLLFLQASLQNGKYFSGGIMLQVQLGDLRK